MVSLQIVSTNFSGGVDLAKEELILEVAVRSLWAVREKDQWRTDRYVQVLVSAFVALVVSVAQGATLSVGPGGKYDYVHNSISHRRRGQR